MESGIHQGKVNLDLDECFRLCIPRIRELLTTLEQGYKPGVLADFSVSADAALQGFGQLEYCLKFGDDSSTSIVINSRIYFDPQPGT